MSARIRAAIGLPLLVLLCLSPGALKTGRKGVSNDVLHVTGRASHADLLAEAPGAGGVPPT